MTDCAKISYIFCKLSESGYIFINIVIFFLRYPNNQYIFSNFLVINTKPI